MLLNPHTIVLLVSFTLFTGGLAIFFTSLHRAQHNQFYSDTFWLVPFGIYVWGDGLILGPFWMVTGLISFWLNQQQLAVLLLLFIVTRSFFEIIYWLNHQASQQNYTPPLFRRVQWLDSNQSAILYQLIHLSVIILAGFGLMMVVR